MLFIKEEDVKTLLSMDECIRAVEDGYRAMGLGDTAMTPRENLWLSPPASIKTASAALPRWGYMGVHAYPGGYGRKSSTPTTTLLYSSHTGQLLATIESRFLSWYRTGATTAVATKYLAVRDARSAGIFGTGRQARAQLRALHRVLPLSRVRAYSPTREHRESFASEMSKELGLDITSTDEPRPCVEDAEVVLTITTAKEPVFQGKWLHSGTHVNALGAHYPEIREVDTETVKRSRVIVDSREQALEEKGELLIPIREGIITPEIIRAELG